MPNPTSRTRLLLVPLAFVLALVLSSASAFADAGSPPPGLRVAVVRSQTTLDWLNNRGGAGNYPHGGKEAATFAYLKSRGYNVTEIIGDQDLMSLENLKQYDVIVLPMVFAISTPASEVLVRYVGEGGGIVSSLASPRAAPEFANPPGTKNDMREWWWHVMDTNTWEWGPLSQVYQASMVNDNFTPVFGVMPNPANPVVTGAQEILGARGYSPDVSGMSLIRDPGAGLELALPLRNTTASSVAYFDILDPVVRHDYPGTYTAAMSANYRAGRSVYFYYSVVDFLPKYNTALYRIPSPSGAPQGEVAGAMLESAIRWAGTPDGAVGLGPSALAFATVTAKPNGMTSSIRVRNTGTLITYGTLKVKIYNSKGKVVHAWTKKRVSLSPGASRAFTDKWNKRIGSGRYRVVVSYTTGYPFDGAQTITRANVKQGKSVKTK